MMTLAGGKAAGIAKWAWSDPETRVQTAIEQVNELATQTTDPDELAEIGDTATMLSRLAGTLHPEPVTISSQLAGGADLILDQILLGHSAAWMHERRGPHGEWISGSGSARSPRTKSDRARHLARARQQRLVAAEVKRQMGSAPASRADAAPLGTGNKAATISDQIRAQMPKYDPKTGYDPTIPTNAPPFIPADRGPQWEKEHEAFFQQRVAPHVAQQMQAGVAKAQENTKKALNVLNAQGEAKAKHDAALKLATEGGIAIAGGVLAYIESKLGVPDLVAIASSVGPVLLQVIIEFFKKL